MMGQFTVAELAASDAELAQELIDAGVAPHSERLTAQGEVASGAETLHGGSDILRPQSQGPFTEEEQLVRRDLQETFEALAAFAGTGRDTAYLVIADFARTVAKRFA